MFKKTAGDDEGETEKERKSARAKRLARREGEGGRAKKGQGSPARPGGGWCGLPGHGREWGVSLQKGDRNRKQDEARVLGGRISNKRRMFRTADRQESK